MSEVKKIRKNTAAIHTGGSVYNVALNYHVTTGSARQ